MVRREGHESQPRRTSYAERGRARGRLRYGSISGPGVTSSRPDPPGADAALARPLDVTMREPRTTATNDTRESLPFLFSFLNPWNQDGNPTPSLPFTPVLLVRSCTSQTDEMVRYGVGPAELNRMVTETNTRRNPERGLTSRREADADRKISLGLFSRPAA